MMAGMAEWHPPAERAAAHWTQSMHFATHSWHMDPAGAPQQTLMQTQVQVGPDDFSKAYLTHNIVMLHMQMHVMDVINTEESKTLFL